ncbi:outer membrane protein with beta-barrel domain [Chitinophaga skermanii]|uniref:Outer membrane protein with beta-barrel domain n=1 Tax=Chitinophaga skermanii TaxID=331697 RepID=A0A327QEI8_9BACT|nr:porin family protein [Chitinophaga skermanii]RAJ02204.1 outer membrane protein with beta-barrel domain [Chitinophaga skermanii]
MKKLLFAAVLLSALTVSTVNAQRFVRFGIKGGANLQKLDAEGFDKGFNWGYHLGGLVQVNLMKGFGVQGEVIFSESKQKTTDKFSDIYTTDPTANNKDIKLNYLSIPIMANIPIALNQRLKLQVGPQYSILMSKNDNLLQNGEKAFKNGDFSVLGGLWLQLPIVNISARYVVGLNDISDLGNTGSWKNQSIQLGVGVTL